MNAKLALLTALLFLATPLAIMPAGAAPGTAPLTCGATAPGVDPIFLAACTVLSAAGAEALTQDGKVVDADRDGRADAAAIADPSSPEWWGEQLYYVIQIDYFYTDDDPATNDEIYNPAGLVDNQQFDFALDPTLRLQAFDSAGYLFVTGPINSGGYFRLSNHFTREVPFTDGRSHSEETFDIAIYTPGEPSRFYSEAYGGNPALAGEGVCLLCVNVASMRVVFGAGTYDGFVFTKSPAEGILDIDAAPGDESIEAAHGTAVLHIRSILGTSTGQTYFDGKRFQLKEVFVKSSGEDIDDDGFDTATEQSCNSNPTNPRSTCDDVDGDGLLNEADDFPFVPLGDGDLDGIADGLDNCPTIANVDQADFNGDGVPGTGGGDACTDFDGDGVRDGAELAGSSNSFCFLNNNGVSVKKAAGCPADEPLKSGKTDPLNPDSDGDTLSDGSEMGVAGQPDTAVNSDPNNADSDGDSLSDAVEDTTNGGRGKGNPTLVDTDADTIRDAFDNCIPTANGLQSDIDADGIGDACEAIDTADMDNDGVSNKLERDTYCTDMANPDTDGDGLTDKQEIDDNKRSVNYTSGNLISIPGTVPPQASGPLQAQADAPRDFFVACRPAATVPVIGAPIPQVPAFFMFMSPVNPDSNGDGVQDAISDLGDANPSRLPSVSTFSSLFPTALAGPVQLIDEYDPHDVNGDGRGNQFNEATGKYDVNDKQDNGQVDTVERNVFYYDPDEAAHSSSYAYGRFEGNNGVTMTMYDNQNGKAPITTLRFGDVQGTTGLQEVVVFENVDLLLCVVIVDGSPAVYSSEYFQDDLSFRESPSNPCGTPTTTTEIETFMVQLLGLGDPFVGLGFYEEGVDKWFEIVDEDKDGAPEEIRIHAPQDPTCPITWVDGYCAREDPIVIPLAEVEDGLDTVISMADPIGKICADGSAGADSILCKAFSESATLSAKPLQQPYAGNQSQAIKLNATGAGGSGNYSCIWTPLSAAGSAVFTPSASSCATNVTYTAAGKHYLQLKVMDDDAPGVFALKTVPVTVALVKALEADPGLGYSGLVNTTINLAGSAINPKTASSTCVWAVDPGGLTLNNATSCTGANVTSATAGVYQLKLTVNDTVSEASKNTTVTVKLPAAQTVAFSGHPYAGATNQNVTLTPVIAGGTAPFSCVFSSNGTAVFTNSTGALTPTCDNVLVRFAENGPYNLSVSVTDHHGRSVAANATINVTAPQPLNVSLAPTETSAFIGDNVTFTGTKSGGAGNTECLWSSNVTANVTIWSPTSCTGTNVTYGKAGLYNLTFEVTSGSEVNRSVANVSVTRKALEANAGPDQEVAPGAIVSLVGAAANTTTSFACAWTAPEGVTLEDPSACTTNATMPATADVYDITLKVTDADSTEDTDTVAITVAEPACLPGESIFPDCATGELPEPMSTCADVDRSIPVFICQGPEGTGVLGQGLMVYVLGITVRV